MMSKEGVLQKSAVNWITNENQTGEEPQWSVHKTLGLFNDNGAADEIADYLVEAGEDAGFFVEPEDVPRAYFAAKEQLTH